MDKTPSAGLFALCAAVSLYACARVGPEKAKNLVVLVAFMEVNKDFIV